ncbi:peroxisomal biogenesis factor 19 [Schistocerca piceifrons]|uniref:peroxisomal biogenesis factor 19 n=1 Tax=Schistocerca piceifrons TaxID=274613 RepID=UPI001F5FBB8B|nr:peroxisomal biogenesis factor 19 [Schistocerca piceifrons]XP_047097668.1 peroxisomal biogenesis factor 19 [Schistocerca piceifrons]
MAEAEKGTDTGASESVSEHKSDAPQVDTLDNILDSALEDFDNPPPNRGKSTTDDAAQSTSSDNAQELLDNRWTEEFIKEATAALNLDSSSSISAEEFGATIQKIAEAAGQAISEDTSDSDFTETISRTLKNLSEGADGLQNEFSDEQMANLLGGLGLGEGGDNDFLKFMQTMMQSLLSKEILYPTMKDIVDKYPAWLEENKSKLATSEYERYSKQKELMTRMCEELEKEDDTDSAEVKEKRCNLLLDLMQKMQNCGHPPKDLVGDMNSVITFDEQGNPVLPSLPPGADPSQCAVM